jgi:hypothetical protein
MKDKVYKLIELTGTSTKSIEDAVNTALKRAGKTIQNLGWFQVVETRGSIEKNQVDHWQVTIKVGFTVDESQGVLSGGGKACENPMRNE